MDTFEAILKSLPKTAFKLNTGGTAYVDITGRGVTLSSTPSLASTGLVSGSTKAAVLASGTAFNFPATMFVRSQEQRGFTLECTLLPMDSITNFISILSHDSVEDGLYIKNGSIHFTVEFNTLGTVTASFPIPAEYESYMVQAVYAVDKIQLYVNGYLYAEQSVTPAQRKDGFKVRASNNLYVSQGTASGKRVGMDGIAVYHRAITDAEAYLHYQSANYVVPKGLLASAFGGAVSLDGGSDSRSIVFSRKWEPNWLADALFNSTAVQDSKLVPELDYTTQISKAGTWSVPVNIDGWPTIYGMVLRWTGSGVFTVEVSLNGGTSWTTATNGVIVTGTYGISTTSVKPLIRITFTGGVLNDTANLSSLSTTVYADGLVYSTDANRALPAASTTTTWDQDYEPIERGMRKGISLLTGPYTLPADANSTDPSTFQTVETWVMFDTLNANQYVYDLRPGVTNGYLWVTGGNFVWVVGTVYINGAAATTNTVPLAVGRWNHIVHVLPTSQNTALALGSNVAASRNTYAVFNLHPAALTANEALSLFNGYHYYPSARIATDSNPVTEGVSAYKIYQNDWALTETGM